MNKSILAAVCLTAFLSAAIYAEPAAPVVSTATESGVSVLESTDSVVITSTAAVEERAMTDRPGPDIFVTLTRSAFPFDRLPTTAEAVTPKVFKSYDAQNGGEAISRLTSVQTLPVGRLGSLVTARIRGSSSNQTLVLIDGRPMGGVALGTPDLSEIPIENIDRIEVLRGGVSALYGPNAMGGVVNVITKRATYSGKPISHVAYETRSYGTQIVRLNFGSRYGPFDYFFSGNQQRESGFRDNSDARTHNIGGNVGLSMGAGGKLLFDVSSFHANAGSPNYACGPTDQFCFGAPASYLVPSQYNNKDEKLASSPTARQVTDSSYIRSSYILPLPANMLLALRLFGSQREVEYDDSNNPNFFNVNSNDRREQSRGGEVQANLPFGLTVGGNFIHDREDNTDRLAPSNSFIKSIENYGIFAQQEFHYGRFTLIPSGRFDHNSQAGESKNPRVQLIADATPWLRISGSAGRSFRAPKIDDLFFVNPFFNGNPNLRPETAWTYDGGFELHADSVSFRATYFRANIRDLIQTRPITFDTVDNVGTARRQGAELQVDHTITPAFRESWNYTFLENRGIPTGFDHLVPLALSPHHTVNYMASLTPATRWKIDTTARFEGSRYAGNNETGLKLGSQLTWDMRLAYQLRQLEIYLGVVNITNKRYQEQPGFPLPGRTAYGGVTLRLWE